MQNDELNVNMHNWSSPSSMVNDVQQVCLMISQVLYVACRWLEDMLVETLEDQHHGCESAASVGNCQSLLFIFRAQQCTSCIVVLWKSWATIPWKPDKVPPTPVPIYLKKHNVSWMLLWGMLNIGESLPSKMTQEILYLQDTPGLLVHQVSATLNSSATRWCFSLFSCWLSVFPSSCLWAFNLHFRDLTCLQYWFESRDDQQPHSCWQIITMGRKCTQEFFD